MSNRTTQNHRISLQKARQLTQKFREVREKISIPGQAGIDLFPVSETFSREGFDALLAQPGCTSVRIYYGLDDQGLHAVIVGVDANNRDILAPLTISTNSTTADISETTTTTGDEIILDEGIRCPPSCPTTSNLTP